MAAVRDHGAELGVNGPGPWWDRRVASTWGIGRGENDDARLGSDAAAVRGCDGGSGGVRGPGRRGSTGCDGNCLGDPGHRSGGRIHFNTQTADFAQARAFYRRLGFTDGVGGFPKTNTHQMARSLGMDDLCSYEIQEIEVISIPDSWGPTSTASGSFNGSFPTMTTHRIRRQSITSASTASRWP